MPLSPLYKILNEYPYELKKSMKNKDIIIVKSTNRTETQKEIEKKLSSKKIPSIREKNQSLSGSMDTTVINDGGKLVVLVFKPQAGGMSETTLNSTITELAPALAFVNNYKPKTVEDFYNFLKGIDHKTSPVYVVQRDIDAGKKFVDDFPKSSKFKEKMENAMGVLKYLNEENSNRKIKNVYWGYRAKPKFKGVEIDSKHKGDLFIEYTDGTMTGLSLKAGEEKSKEPKLNTYVNPIMENIDPQEVDKLRKELWEKVYSIFNSNSSTYDKQSKRETITKLASLEKKNVQEYDRYYDTGLDIIRNTLTKSFEKNTKNTVDYLRAAIVGDAGEVPLLVLKAFGTSFKILTDEDDVAIFLPKTKKIKSYPSTTSKQDFYIELIGKDEKMKLKFAVRTNKTGDEHKLGQFFNLAVKFNGIV